ncbi:AGE family epimerase/isomerase [Bacteroidota bacterium]
MYINHKKTGLFIASGFIIFLILNSCTIPDRNTDRSIPEYENILEQHMLKAWYPRCVDTVYGGYYSDFDADWNLRPTNQQKLLVTQTRHVWSSSKAWSYFRDSIYTTAAMQGMDFLRSHMYDEIHGGFFMLRNRDGSAPDNSYRNEKRTYGMAFVINATTAYFEAFADSSALDLAVESYLWVEKHSYDPIHDGYYDHLSDNGDVLHGTMAKDSISIGMKDYNSTLHLLEAYRNLYRIWPDEELGNRLKNLLTLLQDHFFHEKGYMLLHFTPEWEHVSFKDSTQTQIQSATSLDFLTCGHDLEVIWLMHDAARLLDIEDDDITTFTQKVTDHVLKSVWDKENGGIYDKAFYFNNDNNVTILKNTKMWWAQAEALYAFLYMYLVSPDRKEYLDAYQKQWNYIKNNLIDYDRGGWYEYGLDTSPGSIHGRKSYSWKVTFHDSRAMWNCIELFRMHSTILEGK